jgi:hypothetical protein
VVLDVFAMQKVAEEIDDRDWRTRDAIPAAATSPNASKAAAQPNRDANWDKAKEQQQQQADGPTVSADAKPAAAAQPTTTQPTQPAAAAAASTTGQAATANAGEVRCIPQQL